MLASGKVLDFSMVGEVLLNIKPKNCSGKDDDFCWNYCQTKPLQFRTLSTVLLISDTQEVEA